MIFSHDFSRPETLHRANYWLKRWGFAPSQMQVDPLSHRMTFQMTVSEFAEVDALINALESVESRLTSDIDPNLWEAETQSNAADMQITAQLRSPISWHPEADSVATEEGMQAVIEAIRSMA